MSWRDYLTIPFTMIMKIKLCLILQFKFHTYIWMMITTNVLWFMIHRFLKMILTYALCFSEWCMKTKPYICRIVQTPSVKSVSKVLFGLVKLCRIRSARCVCSLYSTLFILLLFGSIVVCALYFVARFNLDPLLLLVTILDIGWH